MRIREWMNDNPMIVYGVTGVIIFVSVILIMVQKASKRPEDTPTHGQAIFYDPISKKEIRLGSRDLSPHVKDGVTYYRVRLYSCGDCSDESKYFKGYMEKHLPKARRILEEEPEHPDYEKYLEGESLRYALVEPDEETGKIRWTDDIRVVLRYVKSQCKKNEEYSPCSPKFIPGANAK